MAVSPNGKNLYVTNSGSNSVSVINVTTDTVFTTDVAGSPFGVAISPTGKYIDVTDLTGNTVTVLA